MQLLTDLELGRGADGLGLGLSSFLVDILLNWKDGYVPAVLEEKRRSRPANAGSRRREPINGGGAMRVAVRLRRECKGT